MKLIFILLLSILSAFGMNSQNNTLNLFLKDGTAIIDKKNIYEYTTIFKEMISWQKNSTQPIVFTHISQKELNACEKALTKTPETAFEKHYRTLSEKGQTILCNGAGKLGCASLLTQIISCDFPQDVIKQIEYSMNDVTNYCIYRHLQLLQDSIFCQLENKHIKDDYIRFSREDGSLVNTHKDLFNENNLNYIDTIKWYIPLKDHTASLLASKHLAQKPEILYSIIEEGLSISLHIEIDENISSESLILNPENEHVECIAFSKDGQFLAISLEKEHDNLKIIKLGTQLDYSDCVSITPKNGHSNFVTTLVFNPQSTIFVSGSNTAEDNLKTWDFAGNLIQNITNHKGHTIDHIIFSLDGSRLITCSYDEATNTPQLILFDASNDKNIKQLKQVITNHNPCAEKHITKISFAPSGNIFAFFGENNCCIVCDSNTGQKISRTDFQNVNVFEIENLANYALCGIVFSHDEKFFVAFHAGRYSKIIIADVYNTHKNYLPLIQFNTREKDCVFIGLTPNMQSLIAGFMPPESNICTTEQWDLYKKKEQTAFDIIRNNTTLLQKYALYRLLQAGKNKRISITTHEQSPVYNALAELELNRSIAYCIKKYLPLYKPTLYEQFTQKYDDVKITIPNWFNSFK